MFDASVEAVNSIRPFTDDRAFDDLHRLPGDAPEVETNLEPGELITAVTLPPPPAGRQEYRKVRDRASYTGGLFMLALAGERLALGAVALKPWRARKAETALAAGASPADAADAELADARGLGSNEDFKIRLRPARHGRRAGRRACPMSSITDYALPNPGSTQNRQAHYRPRGRSLRRPAESLRHGALRLRGRDALAAGLWRDRGRGNRPRPGERGGRRGGQGGLLGVKLVWHVFDPPTGQGEAGCFKSYVQAQAAADPVFVNPRVRYFGEPVALVVADTLENANAAAALLDVRYEEDPQAEYDFDPGEAEARDNDPDSVVGDFVTAFAEAPIQVDETYPTPIQNHCQMEPCATTAWWEGETVVVHTSVQMLKGPQHLLAETLQIHRNNVHLMSLYVGGGFGGKGSSYEDLALAALASRDLGMPVKIALTRQQMFNATVHRPATVQSGCGWARRRTGRLDRACR